MSKKRDYQSAFRSDLVTIYVGPTRQKYTAHKDIITKVDYFAKCLKNFEESETLKITLPEDHPEVFEKLLEYIYYGHIETTTFDVGLTRDPDEEEYHLLLVKVYIDADKYCMEACQNHVMDFFFEHSFENFIMPSTIVELGKRGLRTCSLRKFLIHDVCFLTKDPDWQKDEKDKRLHEGTMQLITAGGDDAEDFFIACMRRSTEQNSTNDPGLECSWHTHNTTEKCSAGKYGNDSE